MAENHQSLQADKKMRKGFPRHEVEKPNPPKRDFQEFLLSRSFTLLTPQPVVSTQSW